MCVGTCLDLISKDPSDELTLIQCCCTVKDLSLEDKALWSEDKDKNENFFADMHSNQLAVTKFMNMNFMWLHIMDCFDIFLLCCIHFLELCVVRENICNKTKYVKSHVFWILKKNVKNVKVITCKVLETTQSVSPVSIRLLRPYFNLQFYVMLYVYVFVFRVHSVS